MKKYAKLLEDLNKKRKALVEALEEMAKVAQDESRTFNAEEDKEFDRQRAEITQLDGQIKRTEDMQKMVGESAEEVVTTGNDDVELRSPGQSLVPAVATGGSGAVRIDTSKRTKGQVFVRMVMAIASANGNLIQAHENAKKWKDSTPEVERILKAAVAVGTTADSAWAGTLSEYTTAASEFIELLRPETLIGKMSGFRTVPFMTRIMRETAGATANWVGEGLPKPVSALAFDSITIPHTKIAVIVALTEELVRFSSPSAENTVSQELRLAISQFMDEQFINPAIAASANLRPGAITNGASSVGSAGVTLADVTEDLTTAMSAMITANIALRNRYWVFHPRTVLFLMTLRTAQGTWAFREEMAQGRLLGIPFVQSNSVPLVSGNTIIVLVEASEILLADDGEVTVDMSREATLQMDSAPSAGAQAGVSLWQNNLVGIKAERFVYWARRRAAAVYVITGVAY